jgi:hypothetical protein
VKFKCEVCDFTTKNGDDATKHRKATGHTYKILREPLDLTPENAQKLAKAYAEQVKFAESVINAIWDALDPSMRTYLTPDDIRPVVYARLFSYPSDIE